MYLSRTEGDSEVPIPMLWWLFPLLALLGLCSDIAGWSTCGRHTTHNESETIWRWRQRSGKNLKWRVRIRMPRGKSRRNSSGREAAYIGGGNCCQSSIWTHNTQVRLRNFGFRSTRFDRTTCLQQSKLENNSLLAITNCIQFGSHLTTSTIALPSSWHSLS